MYFTPDSASNMVEGSGAVANVPRTKRLVRYGPAARTNCNGSLLLSLKRSIRVWNTSVFFRSHSCFGSTYQPTYLQCPSLPSPSHTFVRNRPTRRTSTVLGNPTPF